MTTWVIHLVVQNQCFAMVQKEPGFTDRKGSRKEFLGVVIALFRRTAQITD